MQTTTNTSKLDTEPLFSFVKEKMEAGETNSSIVSYLIAHHQHYTTESSLRRFRQRHRIQIPGQSKAYTKRDGDKADCATEPQGFVRNMNDTPILDDPDTMLRNRGLDPEEWYIDDNLGIKVNEWDGPQVDGNIVRYYQAKFTAKRKRPELTLMPVRADGWRPPAKDWIAGTNRSRSKKPKLVVICGDQQAPFQDDDLHRLFCQWLYDNEPDEGVNLGDLMDFPDISRHPDDPENTAHANECMQVAYDLMRGYVDASPNTEWQWMPGNHDKRLRDYLIKNAPRVYDIKRVDTPESDGEIVNRIEYLMRLDELGWQYCDPHGDYEDGQINISDHLAVRHGWKLRQKAGETALKTLETLGYSILVGHTHRQAVVHHTFHEIDGTPRQLLAAETGCMCRLDARGYRDSKDRRFPAYATASNWQRGFATATIYPDGKFRVDLATYVNGVLLWRDLRYE